MRPPNILYILLPLFTVTGALRVSMKTSDVSVLRDENVTIPCDIYDINTGRAISILWKRISEDGTEHDVYEYNNGDGKSYRPGSSMKLMEILKGNAELHIPRVQFSDEGEYTCLVINTPDKADGKATLQVSVPPSADVTPVDPTIEEGAEKTVTCEVHNFYPKDISIRWVQYRKGSSDCETLEIWTCVKNVLNNSDGTYNVTSVLTLKPKIEDNGNTYSSIISHRSLRTELSRNLTLTVTEKKDNTGAVITAVVVTLLLVSIPGLLGFLYFRFIKKDPPTLSEITGNDELIDMNRTTLTCQIMDFRPKDIEISVCMRRSGEEEMRSIYTWRSGGLHAPVRISRDDGGGDEVAVDMEEGRQLMNGSAGHEDRPLQLEMTPVISMKKFGAFICQCSLQITPSYDLDKGAELSVHVKHPALTSPVSTRRTLNVIGVPPKLLSIMSPERINHEEQLTLTCPINGFKPRDLSITWLRRERNHQETQLITWNSGSKTNHSDRYSHSVKENEHDDKSYSYISALILKPNIREDDGVTYICRTFHPATNHQEDKEQILNVTAVPMLDCIVKGQDSEVVRVGEKMDLSCRIHSFYPRDIEVTWYTENDVMFPSHTTDPLPDNDGLYHVTSSSSYTPTMKDLGKKLRCQVQHVSLSRPKSVTWKPEEIFSPPALDDIICDPTQPEFGNTVTFSCSINNMYPGNPTIQWYRGLTKFKPDDWTENFQKDSESKIFSGTTELTFSPTSEEHGVPIRLEITHGGKTFIKEYPLHLKGFPVLSEISSGPDKPDYGRSLTLRCDVTGCNPGYTPEVTWSESGRDLGKGETRGSGDVLSCYLTITPTAQNYGKVYSCKVTHKDMKYPIEKKIHLRLPERPPTLSDIVVHPTRVTANQKASFQVTISGFSPRELQIKWYKEFSTFPQSEVTILDPEIGTDGLYKSSSTLTFTPKMSDDNTSLRCEVTHSQSKTIREKRYTLHLTGDSRKAEATKTGPEKKFQIRDIKCVPERPRVGEEVTLVAYIEECQADSAEFTWYTGMYPIDGEMENRQDGTGCTSTITFTLEDSDKDCPIKLEVFYNYQTAEESFTLPLV